MSKKYNVNFINQNLIIEVNEKTTVAKVCEAAGFSLDLVCNGKGTCGKCKVEIESNNLRTTVLACNTIISCDLNIYLSKDDYIKKAKILNSISDSLVNFKPALTKSYFGISQLKENTQEYLSDCNLYVLRKFSNLFICNDCKGITFIRYNSEIIDFQLNDTTEYLYGAAIDIGTTTVALYIYDLNNGKLLRTYSDLNKQISFGADVISRINYADNEKGLNDLNSKIMITINNMVQKAEIELPHFKENLYNIVLCGNSTMQHLFLNLRPDSLGISPFVNVTNDYVECFGSETLLDCTERCKIVFLPLLGGYIGADTASVLLTIEEDNKNRLIIDLGTNGEIAIGNINKYYVASTSCGPSLEGGNIECGMMATDGAVDKFEILNDDIIFNVIGGTNPVGICGSGIIDITAELIKAGLIDKTGRLLTKDEYNIINPDSCLGNRLVTVNGINSFLIDETDKKIYITQKDIRQIQLAKSSIYSGCMALMKEYNIEPKEIGEVIIAGAFGNYIDVNNSVKIGLLPNFQDKITMIGNGAGKGTAMFLLNKDMRSKFDKIVENTEHIKLADNSGYYDLFIQNMNF